MKPSSIVKALNKAIEAKRPVMLLGAPGVGKSDVVAQVATKRGVELRDVRLSLLDPVDLKGFPIPDHDNKQMTWLPPDFLPAMTVKKARALLNTKDGKKTALPDQLMPNDSQGILFLDELPSAPQAVQAAAYQLILNREIGNYTLPEGWAIIAAGNREEDRAVVHKMPPALDNRFVHLNFDIHLDDWCEWALDNGIEHGQRAVKDNFDCLMTYVERMPVEFQVVFVRDAVRRTSDTKEDVGDAKAYTAWAINNSSVLV